jgi:molybdopterin-containing oxidoreductase family iron-sulfur binding subunit
LIVSGGVSTMHSQGLETALLTGLLQWALGSIGSTVDFAASEDYDTVGTMKDVERLTQRLDRSDVGVVFLSRVDAISGLSGKLSILDRISKAKVRVGLGSFMTEAMEACDLVLPISDVLESWGDSEAKRGTLSVIQPVIEPIHNTMSEGDVLLQLTARARGAAAESYQQFLFRRWKGRLGDRSTEKLLADGYVRSGLADGNVTLNRNAVTPELQSLRMKDTVAKPALVMTPSIRFFDGRSREHMLLNEIPDPITTISYGGWVSMSEATAGDLGVGEKDEVSVKVNGWSRELPVKLQQGMPRGITAVQYGAVDAAPVAVDEKSGELVAVFEGASVNSTGKTIALPILSGSLSQEGRGVIPESNHEDAHHHDLGATLYPDNQYKDYRWAMAVDLDLCIGCSACASACYVENNVSVVGPDLHLQGREMSWMRIEPFYDENDEAQFQPMLCQHCSNAPCETVCPVFATYHNEDGLNAQVYNRCVGTRYCLNNCPYKVRRFNWFDWERPTVANPTRNPEVSVRGKGVMEKCSFCVQRIRKARDHAKDNDRKIQDGEIVTACQQACPTDAITFGNIKDEHSEVYKKSQSDRVHRVFEVLGTQPAVYYLKSKWKSKHGQSTHTSDSTHG